MKVCITGSSGMVGKNLLEHPEINSFFILAPTSTEINLLNYTEIFDYLNSQKPDLIIHCAGRVGGIQANINNPYAFLSDNLLMGLNLVKAAQEVGIKRFLNLSSSCSYPRNIQNPLKEEYILQGELEPTNEGYALAKVALLKLCEYLSKQNNEYQYKTLIPCNLYGRWDKFDPKHSHMIPAVIKKIHEAKINNKTELEIWGDGSARREFMYVGDLADFIIKAINNFDSLPLIMNIGLGYDFSINEYYQTIAEVLGYKGQFSYDLSKPIGMKQKLLDISKQKALNWVAQTNLKDGIKKTYQFFMKEALQK